MRLSPRLHADGIYLDHQATDRPRPEVVQAVMHFMSDHFGNANAGANERGRLSRHYLNLFREAAASLVGGRADTLLFTSGTTESNNLVMSSEGRRRHAHLAVSAIEHKCVIESAERARRMGARVSILPVTPEGVVELEAVWRALADGATLVSVMAANNEIGTLCNNLNGGFMGIPALMLMRRAPELHFSAGSARTGSGDSHVLKAIGLPRDKIDASFRLSVGWATTDDDIDQAIASFERVLKTFSRH